MRQTWTPWLLSCWMALACEPVRTPRLDVSSRCLAPLCASHCARANPNLQGHQH